MVNKVLLFLGMCGATVFMIGCGKSVQPKSTDEIILSAGYYVDSHAVNLAVKYRDQLQDVVNHIRQQYHFTELEFTGPTTEGFPNGVGFCTNSSDPNDQPLYLCLSMFTTTRLNTRDTSYSMRATSVFRRYGRDLLEILYDTGIVDDEDVKGVSLTVWWHAVDFENQTDPGKGEGFNIFAPTEAIRHYLDQEIDGQQFLRQCKVMGGKEHELIGEVQIGESDQE